MKIYAESLPTFEPTGRGHKKAPKFREKKHEHLTKGHRQKQYLMVIKGGQA